MLHNLWARAIRRTGRDHPITTTINSLEVPGHVSFRDEKAKLLQSPADFWGSRVQILFCQAPELDRGLHR